MFNTLRTLARVAQEVALIFEKYATADACSALITATERLLVIHSFLEVFLFLALITDGTQELLFTLKTSFATVNDRKVIRNTHSFHVNTHPCQHVDWACLHAPQRVDTHTLCVSTQVC